MRLFVLALLILGSAEGEPSFARKYKADCSLCHTVYPRLNRTGYEFRRLGYRFPREVEQRLTHQQATPANTPSPAAPHVATPADTAEGVELYEQLHCASCHSIEGHGGMAGPALDGIAARRPADYIAVQITDPRQHNPSSIMPAFSLSEQQTRQIVAYLQSLPSAQQESSRRFNPLDYLGYTWNPAIFVDQFNGTTDASYDTRTMIVFLAGTLGDHLSMFVESNPAVETPGFASKWNEAQGTLNFGDSENFTQIRFGQVLTLQGEGFGGTDRFFSETLALIYDPINGFAAARLGRGTSAEYTTGMSTTIKVFGADDTDSSRVFGGVWEQVIGKEGLSGVSVEFAEGWNPNLRSSLGRDLHFQRWYASANKTFQDQKSRQILNLIGGFSFLNDNQYIGEASNQPSRGYGSFLELDTFPMFRHVSPYFRFDQLRPTTQNNASMKAGTAGVAIDVTRFTRLLLEYQRMAAGGPSNFFTVAFRVNL